MCPGYGVYTGLSWTTAYKILRTQQHNTHTRTPLLSVSRMVRYLMKANGIYSPTGHQWFLQFVMQNERSVTAWALVKKKKKLVPLHLCYNIGYMYSSFCFILSFFFFFLWRACASFGDFWLVRLSFSVVIDVIHHVCVFYCCKLMVGKRSDVSKVISAMALCERLHLCGRRIYQYIGSVRKWTCEHVKIFGVLWIFEWIIMAVGFCVECVCCNSMCKKKTRLDDPLQSNFSVFWNSEGLVFYLFFIFFIHIICLAGRVNLNNVSVLGLHCLILRVWIEYLKHNHAKSRSLCFFNYLI